MIEDLRIPASVRRKIGMPPGLITVRFGASDPLDEPGGYRYEISADDRALIDQVIKDNQSPDVAKQKAAFEAWSSALRYAAPGIDAAMMGFPVGEGLSLVLDFLGQHVLQPFNVPVDSGALAISNQYWSAILTGFTVSEPYPSGPGWRQDVHQSMTYTLLDWDCSYISGTDVTDYTTTGLFFTHTPQGSVVVVSASGESSTPSGGVAKGDYSNILGVCDDPRNVGTWQSLDDNQSFTDTHSARDIVYTVGGSGGICFIPVMDGAGIDAVEGQPVCPGEQYDFALPDLGSPSDIGTGDIPDFGLTEDQLNDLLDSLKDSPYYDNYAPPGGAGDGVIPIGPGPGPGGTGGDPGDIGDIDDPGVGDVALDPSDPGFPCGPPSGFNLGPGLDNLKQDRGIGKSPYSSFKPPPGSGPDDFKPGTPVCLKVAGSSKKCGTVGNYVPPDLGKPGHVGVFHPPRTEDVFTHARCYKNKNAGEIAKELAKELGVDPDIVVDEGCKARFTGCFKKGSSKWDAMWKMADLCGYGVFPPPCDEVLDPNCSGNVGPIHPLPIHHGPYHENRDVFSFSRVYDDTDVPAYVVYWRPPYKGDAGFEIVVKVDTIYAVPADKWEFNLVPRKTTEHEAAVAASRKAAAYGLRGLVAEFAVPYNPTILERHQVKVRRPSEGIDINYMAIDIRHDLSAEGWLTIVRGSELRTDHYAPKFEEVY